MEYRLPEVKIAGYLLVNPRKCGFFLSFGYAVAGWPRLRDDLLRIAENFPHMLRRHTAHGAEYEIIGQIQAPNGRTISIRTGWIIRADEPDVMSFVTAYPA